MKKIIRQFKEAIKISKKRGIDFIAISLPFDGVFEIYELDIFKDCVVGYNKNNEPAYLDKNQIKELLTNCKEWKRYENC